MKLKWTESDVKAFPAGENDAFDRKAGLMVNDPDFRRDLGKALSAFANSGGGQILLGVRNDGTFDGIDPLKGRTPTREWLEQVIPQLTNYPLSRFRVHEVESAMPSDIPLGKVAIVIDIVDSPNAPHQASDTKIYYYRAGGHSVPAPHFYLEALRNRLVKPILRPSIIALAVDKAFVRPGGILVTVRLRFRIVNEGRVAAYRWFIDLSNGDMPMVIHDDLGQRDFPRGGVQFMKSEGLLQKLEKPILPSLSCIDERTLGFFLCSNTPAVDEVAAAISQALAADFDINYCVVSENARGDPEKLDMQLLRDNLTAEHVNWLLPCQDAKYLGSGYVGELLSISRSDGSMFRECKGVVTNKSNESCAAPIFRIRFLNDVGQLLHTEEFKTGRLPIGETKRFEESVRANAIARCSRVEMVFFGDDV